MGRGGNEGGPLDLGLGRVVHAVRLRHYSPRHVHASVGGSSQCCQRARRPQDVLDPCIVGVYTRRPAVCQSAVGAHINHGHPPESDRGSRPGFTARRGGRLCR